MPKDDVDLTGYWHLDKRVPIALLVAIILQTSGAIWWAATIQGRVDRLDEIVGVRATDGDRLIALEIRLESVQRQIMTVDAKVDTILTKLFQGYLSEP